MSNDYRATNYKNFRFWCQKVLPLVYDDSLSYYEILCKVVAYLKNMATTTNENADKLNYYINLFEDFINTFDINSYVSTKLDQMAEDGTLDSLVEQSITNYSVCECNMIAEKHIQEYLDGAAYIGDNKIVYYAHSDNSNTGHLICFNAKTYTELWSYELELYHGNSITYNKKLNRIYVCGCFSYNDSSTLIPNIFEIDLDNPAVINNVIELSRGCYSFAYNESTNKYYAICSRGSTAGSANRVFIYDSDFNEEGYIDLNPYPGINVPVSTQGIQLALNNKLYLACYSPENSIYVYDLNGKLISRFGIPNLISGYKYIYELESILYDFDNDVVIIAGRSEGHMDGYGSMCAFAETNLASAIVVRNFTQYAFGQAVITCFHKPLASYKPANLTGVLCTFFDALNFATNFKGRVLITMQANSDTVSGTSYLRSCDIVLTGNNNKFHDLRLICSTARIENVEITGYASAGVTENKQGNIVVESSLCTITNSTLHNAEDVYGIIGTINSNINTNSNTYSYEHNKAYLLYGSSYASTTKDDICLSFGAGEHQPVIVHSGTISLNEVTDFNRGYNVNGFNPSVIYVGSNANEVIMNPFYYWRYTGIDVAYGSMFWSGGQVYERYVKINVNLSDRTVKLLECKQRQPDGTFVDSQVAHVTVAI